VRPAPDEKKFLRGSGYICVQNWSYRDFRPMLLSGDAADARDGIAANIAKLPELLLKG
jgi:hypothetical protein